MHGALSQRHGLPRIHLADAAVHTHRPPLMENAPREEERIRSTRRRTQPFTSPSFVSGRRRKLRKEGYRETGVKLPSTVLRPCDGGSDSESAPRPSMITAPAGNAVTVSSANTPTVCHDAVTSALA